MSFTRSKSELDSQFTGHTVKNEVKVNLLKILFGSTAFIDFADETFSTATITARGALIYNTTPAHTYTNPSIVVLDFGGDKSSTSGDFTIIFPTADASNAILRLA